MEGIVLKKNGSKLEFVLGDSGKTVLYDFKDNSFISHTGRRVQPNTLKTSFRKFGNTLNREESEATYSKLFDIIARDRKNRYRDINIGIILENLGDYSYTEKYVALGFNVVDKIRYYEDTDIAKTNKTTRRIFLDRQLPLRSAKYLTSKESQMFFEELYLCTNPLVLEDMVTQEYKFEKLIRNVNELTTRYNYNPRALAKYVCNVYTYEGMSLDNIGGYVRDYYSMNKEMGATNIDKYPRYLNTTHDIATRNYKSFKSVYDKELFESRINLDLEFKDSSFCIIYPKCYTDIQKEGSDLSHCVASYVNSVLKGYCDIVFMRPRKLEDKSFITVEIKKGKIVQYKGKNNRDLLKAEMDFLEKYAKAKNLKLN